VAQRSTEAVQPPHDERVALAQVIEQPRQLGPLVQRTAQVACGSSATPRPEVFYGRTVASTWRASIQAAVSDAPLAGDILDLVANLAPDAIPRVLVASGVGVDDASLAGDRKRLTAAFNALAKYSLATVDDTTVSVHRLLQKVIRDDLAQRADDTAGLRALDALAAAFPNQVSSPQLWPVCEQLLAHVFALDEALPDPSGAAAARLVALLNAASSYLKWAARSPRFVVAAEGTLARALRLLEADHPVTLESRASLAFAHLTAGHIGDAIGMYERLVETHQRLVGHGHAETLRARSALAVAYGEAGRIGEAIAILTPLAAQEELLGDERPDTLSARHNLASAYQDAGRTEEAIAILEPLLANRTRVFGTDHPRTLSTLHSLADAYDHAGRSEEAIAIYELLLLAEETHLGEEHPMSRAGFRGDRISWFPRNEERERDAPYRSSSESRTRRAGCRRATRVGGRC
jgi:tetratricopeptide (TPR) repeat protein